MRELPEVPEQTFRDWWQERDAPPPPPRADTAGRSHGGPPEGAG